MPENSTTPTADKLSTQSGSLKKTTTQERPPMVKDDEATPKK